MFNNFGQYPYQPYFNQIQQAVQNPQSVLSGKIIDNFDMITANDVPMDGRFSTFIKPDLTEIEVRKWNGDGTIGKMTFKPVEIPKVDNTAKNNFDAEFEEIRGLLVDFASRFESIEKSLDKLSKPTSRARKEE